MNWHSAVRRILNCETGSLFEMAKASGVNSAAFYRGVSLAGVDLRGQDLTMFDLTGSDLSNAIIDSKTLILPEYDPRVNNDYVRKSIRLPRNLYICVRVSEADMGYVYTGWAIKWLIERSFYASSIHNYSRRWTDWINSSEYGQELLSQQGGQDYSLKIKCYQYESLVDTYRHLGGSSKAIKFAILVGIFEHWHATPKQVGSGSILEFMQRVKKRPSADAKLLSLAKSWAQ